MRFIKDRFGNIQCECGCESFYPIEFMDIFTDKLMSTYCIDAIHQHMYEDYHDDINSSEDRRIHRIKE